MVGGRGPGSGWPLLPTQGPLACGSVSSSPEQASRVCDSFPPALKYDEFSNVTRRVCEAAFCLGPHLRGLSHEPMCARWPLPKRNTLNHSKPLRTLAPTSEGPHKPVPRRPRTAWQCLDTPQAPSNGLGGERWHVGPMNAAFSKVGHTSWGAECPPILLYGHRDWLFFFCNVYPKAG